MKAIINEKKAALDMIKGIKPIESLWEAKSILVKYYSKVRNEESNLDIKENIMNLIKKNKDFYFKNCEYNEYIDGRSTDKAISVYTKPMYKLSEDDYIKISKGELEKIRKLNDECAEKLAFVLLVWCKLKNLKLTEFNSWIGDKTKEFYKYSKNRGGVVYQEKMIHRLYRAGLIDLPPIEEVDNVSLNITMIDEYIENEDIAMRIDEGGLRDVVFDYLKWRGMKVINCEVCDKKVLIENIRNTSQKYCGECSKIVKNQQNQKNAKKGKAKMTTT